LTIQGWKNSKKIKKKHNNTGTNPSIISLGALANLSETINSRLPTHPKSSSQNTLDHSNQIRQTASRTSEPKQHHPLITPAPSSLKPPQSTRKPKSNKPLVSLFLSF
jgi:hypothetical protein